MTKISKPLNIRSDEVSGLEQAKHENNKSGARSGEGKSVRIEFDATDKLKLIFILSLECY